MMENDVISAAGLAAGYERLEVWRDANFSVGRGEFVAVLGPNGAGKTTLFRLLLGLDKPLQGALTIFGRPPSRGNQRIGYVPQRHAIASELRLEAVELVRFGLIGNRWGFGRMGQGRDEALAALRAVGAADLARRPLGALSGGELQRIFFAEALVGRPDLLLLDEPLANLDIRREADFVQWVNTIVHSRGITALLIAHNINPLLPVLDRVIYVANGRVMTGRPSDILTTQSLSDLYGIPVEVVKDSRGRIAIIGTEDPAHHHEHDL
ncbi:MAG: ATP-binding cassette domain-containing protein [Verrucomicrobia bacterium]|nr:ATP-binding cassette domain-containing protein [Verrucomicrobiota bacterium]MDE3099630.1 ATP-binding cassette domain-containing protein [Verrucomicrobiota bacterium]